MGRSNLFFEVSGNTTIPRSTPSDADIKVTRDLIRAGQLSKIEILDHVILGDTIHSMRQLGFLG
jgi:DNA repair protein RadC